MTSRSERFRYRVRKEREVLTVFSSHLRALPLHGLSGSAIASWRDNAIQKGVAEQDAEQIRLILEAITRKLGAQADTSKVVFTDEALEENVEIEIAELTRLVLDIKCL
jgi:hypothetical protein